MKTCFIAIALFAAFVSNGQIITIIAGEGSSTADSVLAINSQINNPAGIAVDSHNNLYIATLNSQRIRKVDAITGIITTVAGTGIAGFSGDGGLAINAQFNQPKYVSIDDSDNLYISDDVNERIRKIDALTGVVTTVAGNGTCGYSGDGGLSTNAQICGSWNICFDSHHNVYICDQGNNVVRKIDNFGIITTVAGNSMYGFSGDGGPADSAKLHTPDSIAIDKMDNLYIADKSNQRIRMVNYTTGVITTYVGDGTGIYNGDSTPALNTGINPWPICFDDQEVCILEIFIIKEFEL